MLVAIIKNEYKNYGLILVSDIEPNKQWKINGLIIKRSVSISN